MGAFSLIVVINLLNRFWGMRIYVPSRALSVAIDDILVRVFSMPASNRVLHFDKEGVLAHHASNHSRLLKDRHDLKILEKDVSFQEDARLDLEMTDIEIDQNLTAATEWLLESHDEKDSNYSSVFLELRAGVGGLEAGLFAGEMMRYVIRVAEKFGMEADVLDQSSQSDGPESVRPILSSTMLIKGPGVMERFACEAGVHRVQRKPVTDKSRMHTSTCAISVTPARDFVETELRPRDLEWQFMRSSGGGGQRKDKCDTAALVKHKPTGITAYCEKSRYQEDNKETALQMLAAKLDSIQKSSIDAEKDASRSSHFGDLGRNEKIRTYNFDADRIVDHRCKTSVHGIESYFNGRKPYMHIYEATQKWLREQRLQRILEDLNNELDQLTSDQH